VSDRRLILDGRLIREEMSDEAVQSVELMSCSRCLDRLKTRQNFISLLE